MNNSSILTSVAVVLSLAACSQNTVTVPSPDGNLRISLSNKDGQATVSISYKGDVLVEPSTIGFELEDGFFGKDVKLSAGKLAKIVDDYDMPVGKTSHIHSESNERVVTLSAPDGKSVEMHLRAFDDGVAFRYVFPEQDGMEKLLIKKELMNIRPVGNPIVKAMYLPGKVCSHEEVYVTKPLSEHNEGKTADMPVFLSYPDGRCMAVTEAMVVGFAGMRLGVKEGVLYGELTTRMDNPDLAVIADLPHRSPWRVFLISDRAGALMESTILTTLCDPCPDKDLSWLVPGKATWPWWNGYQTSLPLKGNIGAINYDFSKEYIDFCADNGIDYHSITGILTPEGNEVLWYYNEGSPTYRAQKTDNPRLPYPGFDVKAVCDYARQKDVRMRVWINWEALSWDIEGIFKQFREWGIDGMMVDFMDRDDQEMIEYQEEVLKQAMKYHLHIQFHGASKPSGLNRTYPCEFTRENTLNYEIYKWDNERRMGADHDLNMPFTRCLAGETDYHLGGFRAVPYDKYEVVPLRPLVTSTRCHMLAMYVTLESSLALVSDAPAAYKDQPGFEFIREVPTTWDETKVPMAVVDEYVVTARRKGNAWYIGAIGNSSSRDISLPLDFLGDGEYTMELYTDADDTDADPNHLVKTTGKVNKSDTLQIHLAALGGFAARFSKYNKD